MDVKRWRKALGVGLVTAAAITNSSAYAAQATVTVDVDLPTILVMYHYNTITLTLAPAAVASYLVGGTAVACGADWCDDQGNVSVAVVGFGGTNTVTQAVVDPGLANSIATFTLVDSVGVRAIGCSTYDVTIVEDPATDVAVAVDTASLSAIDGSSCSFFMTTGDLSFDVDFDQVAADPVSAVFDVTIAGI